MCIAFSCPALSAAHEADEAASAPVPPAAAAPVFAARGRHFELVAVREGSALRLYLDGADDNAPAGGARLEVESDGKQVSARQTAPGEYVAAAPWLATAGSHTLRVSAADEAREDHFSGTLTVAPPKPSGGGDENAVDDWGRRAALVVLGFAIAFTALRRGRERVGAAAVALVLALGLLATGARGHDESIAASVAPRGGEGVPHRHADGSVFLPKPTQHLLDIRTMPARLEKAAAAVEIAGRVVADPNGSSRVQAPRDGRIEPPAGGFPHLGQRVRQGEVLAYLIPVLTSFEETSLRQALARIESDQAMIVPQLDRFNVINPNMPMSDATATMIQELQIKAEGLQHEHDAVIAALRGKVEIKAPLAGAVTSAKVAAGQLLGARETLFEIVDPKAARVEGWSFDPLKDEEIAAASAMTEDGRSIPLAFLGRGRVLRQQAVPLLFRVAGNAETVEIGAPVRILIQGTHKQEGVALPREAVVRGPGNLPTVWEHDGPLSFRPHAVRAVPLDDARVLVTRGIAAGMRLVVAGAPLIDQVR